MLTHQQRLDLFESTLVPRLRALLESKGQAYGGETDAHANYRLIEVLGIATTFQAMMARATDKFVRIGKLYGVDTASKQIDEELEELIVCLINAWTERR